MRPLSCPRRRRPTKHNRLSLFSEPLKNVIHGTYRSYIFFDVASSIISVNEKKAGGRERANRNRCCYGFTVCNMWQKSGLKDRRPTLTPYHLCCVPFFFSCRHRGSCMQYVSLTQAAKLFISQQRPLDETEKIHTHQS